MQDRYRGDLPFLWPINLRKLDTFHRDVTNALMFKMVKGERRRGVVESGWASSIDEGRFPKGTYEYRMHLDMLVEQKYPGTVAARHRLEDNLDHGIVQFLPLRGLRNLYADLHKLSKAKKTVTGVLREPWA